MKTTVDLPDSLMARLQELAERDRTTVQALIEEGVRTALERRASGQEKPFKLRDARNPHGRLKPEFEGNWEAIRDEIYRPARSYGRTSRA